MTQPYPGQPAQQFAPQPGYPAAPAQQQFAPPTPQQPWQQMPPAEQYMPPQPAAPNPFTPPNGQQPAAAPQTWQPQPSAPPENQDTSSFFGGADGAFFSFKSDAMMNRWVGGQIVSKRMSPMTDDDGKPQTWPDGNPKYRLIVTCQTGIQTDAEDDGKRSLDVKSFAVKAVAEALREVGCNDVEPMGWLYMAWVGNDPSKGRKGNPAKVWKAVYRPPGSPDPMAGQPVNQLPTSAPQQQFAPPAQQFAAGPIAQQPAQAMQQAYQVAQQDPTAAAAAGYPPAQQFAPQPGYPPAQQFAPPAPTYQQAAPNPGQPANFDPFNRPQ